MARVPQLPDSPSPSDGQTLLYDSTAKRWVPSAPPSGGGSAPDASTSVKGIVQLTNHLGGTATAPTVRAASTTQTGIVELATNTEATTGTDTSRAVTPAGVKAVVDALTIPDSPDDIGAAPAAHDHTAADIDSGAAADGHILTADGAGGAAWEAPSGSASTLTTYTIIETATGTWTADAPSRTLGHNPIIFVGWSDPSDVTDGITTPANINDADRWIQVAAP